MSKLCFSLSARCYRVIDPNDNSILTVHTLSELNIYLLWNFCIILDIYLWHYIRNRLYFSKIPIFCTSWFADIPRILAPRAFRHPIQLWPHWAEHQVYIEIQINFLRIWILCLSDWIVFSNCLMSKIYATSFVKSHSGAAVDNSYHNYH